MSAEQIRAAAIEAREAGLCLLPPRRDGSKRPLGSWKRYQSERPDREQLNDWYAGDDPEGIGVVMGSISGGVEMLEVEARAVGEIAELETRISGTPTGDVWQRIREGYEETTPSGGRHWLLRVTDGDPLGNEKLAAEAGGVVKWETRGEGGFSILAPTNGQAHPSGEPWTIAAGGFATIPDVTADERDQLYTAIGSLDETSEPEPATEPESLPWATPANEEGPADRYNAAPGIQQITRALLERHGWELDRSEGQTDYLRRPGKDRDHSATLGEKQDPPMLYVFTTSAPGFDAGRGFNPFQVLSILEHGGDKSAAAKWLLRNGYAQRDQEPEPVTIAAEQIELPDHLELWTPGTGEAATEPRLPDAAICGPLGEAGELIAAHSEATLPAVMAAMMVRFGAAIGRGTYFRTGREIHRGNLFAVIVGPTSAARKTMSDTEARHLMQSAADYAGATPVGSNRHLAKELGGFGSGESMVDTIADPVYDDDTGEILSGTEDQRLIVHTSELASILSRLKRDQKGGIMGSILREAYDGQTLSARSRGAGEVTSTEPHVALIGQITPAEFRAQLSTVEIANGLANRLLPVWSRGTTFLPFGDEIPEAETLSIAAKLGRALGAAQSHLEYQMSDDAKERWSAAYRGLREPTEREPILNALLGRSATQAIRIALIFAAADQGLLIGLRHIEAGLAWVDYSIETWRALFAGHVVDPDARQILEAIRMQDPPMMKRSAISLDVFGNHRSSIEIEKALRLLEDAELIHRFTGPSSGGRPPEMVAATVPL